MGKETQDRRRTIRESITYMSPRDFISIVRPPRMRRLLRWSLLYYNW